MRKCFIGLSAICFLSVCIACTNVNAKEKTGAQEYKEYKVVSADDYDSFQFFVQGQLSSHFQLVGGVCVYNGRLYQAMAR